MQSENSVDHTIRALQRALVRLAVLMGAGVVALLLLFALQVGWIETRPASPTSLSTPKPASPARPDESLWQAPSETSIAAASDAQLVRYGKELIEHTSVYLGPKGRIAHTSNGMNCQNCHLEAGTKPWGNNYSAVASTFPKFRERSGTVESVTKRVNDCFERSLNGAALDSNGREMKAIVAYINILGKGVPRGKSPAGSGIWKLPFLNRPADPIRGKAAYQQKCVSCHGAAGQGVLNPDGTGYTFPPVWGRHSYNQGAGLYRISRLAGYIKTNMPLGTTWNSPKLTDDEAWDIAAFINSMPRPAKDLRHDWPNLAGKPVDHPFGPYADPFSEKEHKYGPFTPIKNWYEQHKATQRVSH